MDEQLPTFARITDLNGKLLVSENITTPEWIVSTANWSNGMYILTLQNDRGMKTLKLIK
jgi:hypothetical protein